MISYYDKAVDIGKYLKISVSGELTPRQMGELLIATEDIYRVLHLTETLVFNNEYYELMSNSDEISNYFVDKILSDELQTGYQEMIDFTQNLEQSLGIRLPAGIVEDIYNQLSERTRFDIKPLNLKSNLKLIIRNIINKIASQKGLTIKDNVGPVDADQRKRIVQQFQRQLNSFRDIRLKDIPEVLSRSPILVSINYNSPGSLDFLGIGRILEVIKDFIFEAINHKSKKKLENLQRETLKEDLYSKRIENIDKTLDALSKFADTKAKLEQMGLGNSRELNSILNRSREIFIDSSENIVDVKLLSEEDYGTS